MEKKKDEDQHLLLQNEGCDIKLWGFNYLWTATKQLLKTRACNKC